jgi:hypothetical protein
MQQFAGLLAAVPRDFSYALQALIEKGGGPNAPAEAPASEAAAAPEPEAAAEPDAAPEPEAAAEPDAAPEAEAAADTTATEPEIETDTAVEASADDTSEES